MPSTPTSSKGRIGVLLVNLGTPDSPQTGDVRRYLNEFLTDARVIDMPAAVRYPLFRGLIVPLRAPKSAKVYQQLWTERGSPLLYHGLDLQKLVQEQLGKDYLVAFGMRYQKPSIESALQELRDAAVDRIIVLPLFPQYAAASTGSVQEKVMELVSKWWVVPSISFISTFVDDPGFINSFATLGKAEMAQRNYDHVVFSYHGIPERHVLKGSHKGYCKLGNCCNSYNKNNRYCYRAQCFETSRQLAKALGLAPEQYTTSFQSRLQSRLRDPWLQPYTDEVLKEMPAKGIKNVLAFSPAFVADCLETTIEVGEEFKEMFEEAGGSHWQLVPSLNSRPEWVQAVTEMIRRN
ncbi:ferrochelatase [Hymenobacter sp. HSC-4F20]|uniref:ferrochelatase n=1 Tax=Hymenobacter sp. HSC-4F20 TaxID=2864135 RepID=UPI001C72CA99|nr:ferrochelatase [Hymenobacter sp. HSC-4F20]MBX0292806.1 ferrochelatase [Hymenobacter sp. HSC-4F20]